MQEPQINLHFDIFSFFLSIIFSFFSQLFSSSWSPKITCASKMAPGSRHIFGRLHTEHDKITIPPVSCKVRAGSYMSSNKKTKMASNREPVAKGGLWTSHSAPVSKETQNLLKGNTRFLRDTSKRFSSFCCHSVTDT